MKLSYLNRIKDILYKRIGICVTSFIEKANRFFNKIIFEDQNIIADKESQKYWKNRVFYFVAAAILTIGSPLLFFGAYMFYAAGYIEYAIIEAFVYIIIAIVITRKALSIKIRKIFVIMTLYLISLLILITTGGMGGGMTCIFFSLVLTGCLFEKKQIIQIVTTNLLIFIVLSALLMHGELHGTAIEAYKNAWFINVITAQVCGITLILLMNAIYRGLECQTDIINKSKEIIAVSEIKHRAMIANISDVIIIIDEDGVVKYSSPNLELRFGWKQEDILNSSLWDMIYSKDSNSAKKELKNLLKANGLENTMEAKQLCKNGEFRYIELTAVDLSKDSTINGILINYRDITERKIREDKILHLSYHDILTGVYNRTFFEKEKKYYDTKSQLPLSVVTGNINGLKIINNSLGHAEGDKLLIFISNILISNCRNCDMVARIGGDEFVILMPKTSCEEAYEIIKKINTACEEYNNRVSGEIYHASISLGAATKTNISEPLDSIIKLAEDSMYRKKLLDNRSLHSSIISSMRTVLSEKSQETEEHAQRLVVLSKKTGKAMGLSNQQCDELELFSKLHDIGKIGIDDQILNKPSKLTDLEWIEMKKHPEIGYRIAMASRELMSIADYILTHHERWNGKGYPQGLEGNSIPLLSRILSVVDAYDAMTEDRLYRKGMTNQEAVAEIIRNSGTQFDPAVVEIFLGIMEKEKLNN